MGLRGYGSNQTGPAFAEDVLSIKVVGPTGLSLSIVDLPGLISVASEEQSSEDVATVHRMVDTYIGKPRTIILAIVQASNDVANQSIITKSQKVDTVGQRTIGIITKPDLINEGTEGRIAALAKNQDTTKLKLGFFLLKNSTPSEMQQGITAEERSVKERVFFRSPQWSKQQLNHDRVGIENLRGYLQQLLEEHVERELPKVKGEIETMIATTNKELLCLPKARPTIADVRMFLSDVAMQYHSLATAALNGEYHTTHVDFFIAGDEAVPTTRLRARIHESNSTFADKMRDKGQMLKESSKAQVSSGTTSPALQPGASPSPNQGQSATSGNVSSTVPSYPKLVTRDEMLAWVKKVDQSTALALWS